MRLLEKCPHCEEPVEGLNWDATTMIATKKIGPGIFVPEEPERLLNIPPGTYTLIPCGHQIHPDLGEKMMEQQHIEQRKRQDAEDWGTYQRLKKRFEGKKKP